MKPKLEFKGTDSLIAHIERAISLEAAKKVVQWRISGNGDANSRVCTLRQLWNKISSSAAFYFKCF